MTSMEKKERILFNLSSRSTDACMNEEFLKLTLFIFINESKVSHSTIFHFYGIRVDMVSENLDIWENGSTFCSK